jgi:hypothetical protein
MERPEMTARELVACCSVAAIIVVLYALPLGL